jgi:hypothetical protein
MAGDFPITNLTLGTAPQVLPASPRIPLIFAQKTSAGSATSGALYTDIQNGVDVASNLAGAGSIGQIMIDAFKRENPKTRLDVILVDDNGSGVAASGTIAFTATPTASGSLFITVGDAVLNTYELAITTSSTATTIGADLVTAITADTKSPVTAVNTTGSVALTAKSKGTTGNRIGMKITGSVAGVSVALTAFASGATDPSTTGVLSIIDNARYDIIAPLCFLTAVKTHFEAKFNVSNAILDGIGFFANTETYANCQTALAAGTLASKVIWYGCNKKVNDSDFKGGALLTLDYMLSSAEAAMRALRFTPNAILNNFMQAGNDRGGAFMAGIPYQNMKFNNFATIPTGKGFSLTEVEGLGDLGGSTFSNDISGQYPVSNKAWLTCYKAATPTATGLTYATLNKSDCSTTARSYFFNNIKEKYAQSALTSGSISGNQNIKIANAKTIRADINAWFQDLVDMNVLQGGIDPTTGTDLTALFNQDLTILVDTSTGAVSGTMQYVVMGQLDTFDFNIIPLSTATN